MAITKCDEFLRVMQGHQPSIAKHLNKSVAETIAINCQILKSIIETLVLCGGQNIPLRGHCDGLTDIEWDQDGSSDHGNFWALLNFKVGSGDHVLANRLEKAARNATYTSADIQNQLLSIIGDSIQQKIISKVVTAM